MIYSPNYGIHSLGVFYWSTNFELHNLPFHENKKMQLVCYKINDYLFLLFRMSSAAIWGKVVVVLCQSGCCARHNHRFGDTITSWTVGIILVHSHCSSESSSKYLYLDRNKYYFLSTVLQVQAAFVSWRQDSGARARDAFLSEDWSEFTYLFSPTLLMPRVLADMLRPVLPLPLRAVCARHD